MKKFLALTLAAILLAFCFASCGAESDAYSLYVNSLKNAAKGMEAKVTLKLGDIATTMEIKSSETAYAASMEVQGMKTEAVYVDGVLYSAVDLGEMGVQKYKQAMDLAQFASENEMDAQLPELPENVLKDVVIETKDGKTGFTLTLNGKEYSDMLEEAVGKDIASAEDITIICEFNEDGSILLFTMKSKITIAGESLDMEMTMEFSNIGVAPEIKAPADADSYTDLGDLGDELEDLVGDLLG